VLKVLGTGIRGVGLREVEIATRSTGEPYVRLHARALRKARDLGISSIAVSLCHEDDFALAVAATDLGEKPW
jgi:holo-[acyl-carrier protein] synthase